MLYIHSKGRGFFFCFLFFFFFTSLIPSLREVLISIPWHPIWTGIFLLAALEWFSISYEQIWLTFLWITPPGEQNYLFYVLISILLLSNLIKVDPTWTRDPNWSSPTKTTKDVQHTVQYTKFKLCKMECKMKQSDRLQ